MMIKFTKNKIDRVEFIKQHAWYLSIVEVNGKKDCYWSFHNRSGLTDKKAEKAFEYEHLNEVITVIKQQAN